MHEKNSIFEIQWQTNYDLLKKGHLNGLSLKDYDKMQERSNNKMLLLLMLMLLLLLKRATDHFDGGSELV